MAELDRNNVITGVTKQPFVLLSVLSFLLFLVILVLSSTQCQHQLKVDPDFWQGQAVHFVQPAGLLNFCSISSCIILFHFWFQGPHISDLCSCCCSSPDVIVNAVKLGVGRNLTLFTFPFLREAGTTMQRKLQMLLS